MCSGRVDMKHIIEAFAEGADAVFIGGCHLDDCHYITHGNYEALSMTQLTRRLLEHAGVDSRRLRIEWVSAGEGIRFAKLMNEFSREVEKLGPLGQSEGEEAEEMSAKLREVLRLIPYIKIAQREKLALHMRDDEATYDQLYSAEEVEQLLSKAPVYEIDQDKCKACMICLNRCPVGAIVGAKKTPHFIDQDLCIKCGTCLEACPTRFGAISKTSA